MGKAIQNVPKKAQDMKTSEAEPRKRLILKLKLRRTTPEAGPSGEKSESPLAAHGIDGKDVDDEEYVSESESSGDSSSDDSGSDESDEDDSDELDDIFYGQSTQGVTNPILKNATYATDSDWEDFFRLAANKGNKEILNLAKAADPSSAMNIKRVINMVFKGQSRLAKIRGVSLKVVRKSFHKARETNGVRQRQQTIRKATMKENGTGPKGRKSKRGGKGGKGRKTTKAKKEKKAKETTSILDDLDEDRSGLAKLPRVSKTISTSKKSGGELEAEKAASAIVGMSAVAWARQEAAETLLSLYHKHRDFGVAVATSL